MLRRLTILCLLGFSLPLLNGCAYFRNLNDAGRLRQGCVLVLPGIETPSVFNSNVATGISQAGWKGAIEIHDWTSGVFLLWPWHLCAHRTNQVRARELADKIVAYQDEYPGAPIHLFGHSGGGALIVMALEALPEDRQVTTATLITPAISPDHNLSTALSKSQCGIWHFHSAGDVLLLGAGTSVLGTLDREFRPSAGWLGFNRPEDLGEFEQQLYNDKLHEIPYELDMLRYGNIGEHFGPTTIPFSRRYFGPIVLQAGADESDARLIGSASNEFMP